MEWPSIGPVGVRTPPYERISVTPISKARSCLSGTYEHVEEYDVHRRKAVKSVPRMLFSSGGVSSRPSSVLLRSHFRIAG